eukprot:3497250-Amphidinium_carterae.3
MEWCPVMLVTAASKIVVERNNMTYQFKVQQTQNQFFHRNAKSRFPGPLPRGGDVHALKCASRGLSRALGDMSQSEAMSSTDAMIKPSAVACTDIFQKY